MERPRGISIANLSREQDAGKRRLEFFNDHTPRRRCRRSLAGSSRKSALIAWRNPPADVVFCFQVADLFILGAAVVGADAATIALGMADECRRGGLQSRRAAQYRSSVWKFGAHHLFTHAGITETELGIASIS